MKGGEGFGKLPPRGPLKPRPKKDPIWRRGGQKGKTSYEKAEVGRTEPEAKTPASPEGGVPPSYTPIRYLLSHYGPWGLVLVVVGSLLIVSVFIYFWESHFNPPGPGTSTQPPPAQEGGVLPPAQEGGVLPPAQEGGGTQPVAGVNHWVSAVPGKGLRACMLGDWWEYDVDLRVKGSTGTSTVTLRTAPEWEQYRVGVTNVAPIYDWKDDGMTITFTTKYEETDDYYGPQTSVTYYQLTRTPDGHLTGSGNTPPGQIKRSYYDSDLNKYVLEPEPNLEEYNILDLVPAP